MMLMFGVAKYQPDISLLFGHHLDGIICVLFFFGKMGGGVALEKHIVYHTCTICRGNEIS